MLEPIYGPELKSILQELEEYYPQITPTPDWTQSQIMYRSCLLYTSDAADEGLV